MQKKKCCQSLLTIERLEGIFCITPIYKIQHNFLFFANTFVQCIQEILSNKYVQPEEGRGDILDKGITNANVDFSQLRSEINKCDDGGL